MVRAAALRSNEGRVQIPLQGGRQSLLVAGSQRDARNYDDVIPSPPFSTILLRPEYAYTY